MHPFNTPANNAVDTDVFFVVTGANINTNASMGGDYMGIMDAGLDQEFRRPDDQGAAARQDELHLRRYPDLHALGEVDGTDGGHGELSWSPAGWIPR